MADKEITEEAELFPIAANRSLLLVIPVRSAEQSVLGWVCALAEEFRSSRVHVLQPGSLAL